MSFFLEIVLNTQRRATYLGFWLLFLYVSVRHSHISPLLSDRRQKTDGAAYWLFAAEMDGGHISGTLGVTVAGRQDNGCGPARWLMNKHGAGNQEYANECAHT